MATAPPRPWAQAMSGCAEPSLGVEKELRSFSIQQGLRESLGPIQPSTLVLC